MGLFDFMSSAGENEITAKVEVSQDRLNELRQQNISKSIAELDIDGEQIKVAVKGDVATLTGTAPTREAMEKMVLCAGNQHGIGKVDCRVEVAAAPASPAKAPGQVPQQTSQQAAQPESTFYTVKSGDTLGKIAAAVYGDAGKYPVIFAANKPMLKDPNKIYPGQSLLIPPL
jgi:nucleoid-associated protein YgaU